MVTEKQRAKCVETPYKGGRSKRNPEPMFQVYDKLAETFTNCYGIEEVELCVKDMMAKYGNDILWLNENLCIMQDDKEVRYDCSINIDLHHKR